MGFRCQATLFLHWPHDPLYCSFSLEDSKKFPSFPLSLDFSWACHRAHTWHDGDSMCYILMVSVLRVQLEKVLIIFFPLG